jgi:hypothetical protein
MFQIIDRLRGAIFFQEQHADRSLCCRQLRVQLHGLLQMRRRVLQIVEVH